ncbi:MAG: ORF6N domain-containing protein [Bacteroidetes bacterium]|nr:ORF6N domain-containing protein [Bacteroidota bacterium]
MKKIITTIQPPPEEGVFSKIYLLRNQKVLLDEDLAAMYGVATRALNQAVKRNADRFPEDFMFQLSEEEYSNLKSQLVTSSWGGRRKPPLAFTEQGVSMLSSVLRSEQAIAVNIQIMRVFVKMRRMISEYKELLEKIESIEADQITQDDRITEIYNIIKSLLEPIYKDRPPVGFKQ